MKEQNALCMHVLQWKWYSWCNGIPVTTSRVPHFRTYTEHEGNWFLYSVTTESGQLWSENDDVLNCNGVQWKPTYVCIQNFHNDWHYISNKYKTWHQITPYNIYNSVNGCNYGYKFCLIFCALIRFDLHFMVYQHKQLLLLGTGKSTGSNIKWHWIVVFG